MNREGWIVDRVKPGSCPAALPSPAPTLHTPFLLALALTLFLGAARAAELQALPRPRLAEAYLLRIGVRLPAAGAAPAVFAVDHGREGDHAGGLLVELTRQEIRLVRPAADGRKLLGRAAWTTAELARAGALPLRVRRRPRWIELSTGGPDGRLLMEVPAPGAGGGQVALGGDIRATFSRPRVQRLEPIRFADHFERSPGEGDPWAGHGGVFLLDTVSHPERSASPFKFVARTAAPKLATSGYRFWSRYRLRAACRLARPSGGHTVIGFAGAPERVRAAAAGTLGIAFHVIDAEN